MYVNDADFNRTEACIDYKGKFHPGPVYQDPVLCVQSSRLSSYNPSSSEAEAGWAWVQGQVRGQPGTSSKTCLKIRRRKGDTGDSALVGHLPSVGKALDSSPITFHKE